MFATLIEPMWNMLSRILCLLQPFEELRKGNAAASSTIDVKYTNLPPQLTVWRALRAGHLLLASVCIVSISSNILAVALSALLSENIVTTELPFASSHQLSPVFNGTPIYHHNNFAGSELYFVSRNPISITRILPRIGNTIA